MSYKFFDKRFLVFPDQDCLGKKVFFSDTYKNLIEEVESGDVCRTRTIDGVHKDETYPFVIDDSNWVLAYCDPAYEAKVAYSQGKKIQYKEADGEWTDVERPSWLCYAYRVKPDKWYVHPSADEYGNCIGHPFYKDTSNKKFVEFEGTKEECDAWIEEHTPKTRRYTNRELSEWVANNRGQIFKNRMVSVAYYYLEGSDDAPVPGNVKIRAWSETEWHEPLVEVAE